MVGIRQAHHRKCITCILGTLRENRALSQAKYLADHIVQFGLNDRILRRFLECSQVELNSVVTSGFNEVSCIAGGTCFIQQRLVSRNLWYRLRFGFDLGLPCGRRKSNF